jgi:hypothetical protein
MGLIFGAGCFAGFLIAVFAAIIVMERNPRSKLNRSFLLSASASAVYNLFVGMHILSGDLSRAAAIHRVSVTAWLIFLVAQLYFSMALARREDHYPDRLLLGLIALLSLWMAVLDCWARRSISFRS